MDIRSNEPFWLIKNSSGENYPSLRKNLDAEITILGAGITGSLIAYKLIQEGYKPVMLDSRDVFNGSSAASTAMLQYEIDVPLHELIDKVGETAAVESYKECEKAISTIEKISKDIGSKCDYEKKNSIYFTTNPKHVKFIEKEFSIRQKHGFEVELLNDKDLADFGIPDGIIAIKSKSGAVMDPYKFSRDVLKYCSERGLSIYDRSTAKIMNTTNHIELEINGEFKLRTKHLIHCTGYESTKTLKEEVVKLKSTYALASEAYEEIPEPFKKNIFWNTDDPYLYFRSTSDNRIIMGGSDDNFKNAKRRDASLPKKEKKLQESFRATFPNIEFIPDYSWAGTFGETKDGLPYIGKPDKKINEQYILGFGGNGITFSAMAMDTILPSLNNSYHPFLGYYKFNR